MIIGGDSWIQIGEDHEIIWAVEGSHGFPESSFASL